MGEYLHHIVAIAGRIDKINFRKPKFISLLIGGDFEGVTCKKGMTN